MMENVHLWPETPPPMMEIKLIRKINLSNDGKWLDLPPPVMEIKLIFFRPKTPKIAKKHKNARNLVIFWNLGKVKYTIVLEIGCQ